MKKHLIYYTIISIITSLLIFTADHASAEAPEWKFDTAHSRLYFDIDHIFVKVRGHFSDYSGKFLFSPANLAESSINIKIKTKSIDTGISKRDNHLRTGDFFNVKQYPLITFKSTEIMHKQGNLYLVSGQLTIKDVTKTVNLPMTYFGTTPNPFNPEEVVAGFQARITIDRFDYNVGSGKFYKMGVAGKDVNITIALEMLHKKE